MEEEYSNFCAPNRDRPDLHHPAPPRVRGDPEEDRPAVADQPLQQRRPRIRRPCRPERQAEQVRQGAGVPAGRVLVRSVPVNK